MEWNVMLLPFFISFYNSAAKVQIKHEITNINKKNCVPLQAIKPKTI